MYTISFINIESFLSLGVPTTLQRANDDMIKELETKIAKKVEEGKALR